LSVLKDSENLIVDSNTNNLISIRQLDMLQF